MSEQKAKTPVSKRLEERLVRYGAMAVAAAAVATPQPMDAAVIFHDGGGATTPLEGSLFFNMTTGAVSTTNTVSPHFELRNRLFGYSTFTFGPASSSTFSTFITTSRMARLYGLGNNRFAFPPGGTNLAAPFGNNVVIGPGLLFGQAGNTLIDSTGNGLWSNGQRAFLGLQFEVSPGVTRYGWADIQINEDLTVSLGCFAYEDSGGSINTPSSSTYGCAGSSAPEPSSIVLMALGAAGLALYRLRRQKPAA